MSNTNAVLDMQNEVVTMTPQHHLEQAQRHKNEAVRHLLHEWLADESGYDEAVWPQVKQLLEDHRLSARSRFSD